MSDVKLTLSLLIESLEKKAMVLKDIIKYTKEQEEVLKEETIDYNRFNNIMKNKQVRIDKILEIDDGFKPTYERIRGAVKNRPELYKDEIAKMKELIKEIGELGIDIQVMENRNKTQFELKTTVSKAKVKDFRRNKKGATNYYNSIKKQKRTEQSYFFDKKK